MPRLNFGAFLAPHHPVGEHPMLQFRRDLDLVEHLDKLGYEEFWCGEHHSSGWEMIGSPEMFLAAAGERSKRIKLATGVVSLPYHHPFNVAQRMVQLDHMSHGRAIFGSGPGALPSDARTFGIDQVLLRDRQDEALGVIVRLLNGAAFEVPQQSEYVQTRPRMTGWMTRVRLRVGIRTAGRARISQTSIYLIPGGRRAPSHGWTDCRQPCC